MTCLEFPAFPLSQSFLRNFSSNIQLNIVIVELLHQSIFRCLSLNDDRYFRSMSMIMNFFIKIQSSIGPHFCLYLCTFTIVITNTK